MLVGGRLSDLLGRRPVLFAGLGLFAAASVLVALAPGAGLLLAGRGLQGTAGRAAAAGRVRPGRARPWTSVTGTSGWRSAPSPSAARSPSAPSSAGTISQFLHWTVIFWLNLPVVLAGIGCVAWAVPDGYRRGAVHRHPATWAARLDVPGLVCSAAALSSG